MVGRVMAFDLAKDDDTTVVVVDRDESIRSLVEEKGVGFEKADLSDASDVTRVIADADMVIGAVPGFLGFQTMETVIRAKKNMVDIAFMPEDAREHDALARSGAGDDDAPRSDRDERRSKYRARGNRSLTQTRSSSVENGSCCPQRARLAS